MTDETPSQIIERAMTDPAVYAAMATREAEVWGKILPQLEKSEARAADIKASADLRAGRAMSSLPKVARENKLSFEKGLTLGCGAGRLERSLIATGICKAFHGIDISPEAIAEARSTAAESKLALTYEVADLNFVELEPQAFDLVVAQTSLHHVLHLEKLAEQAWKSLRRQGYMWIHDFIGETQGQHDELRLTVMNQILSILPEKFRRNQINDRLVTQIARPKPGRLGSPFECIRSGDIIPVFERWFTIEWKCEFNAFMHLVASPGMRAAYTENDDTKAMFELLQYFDQLCISQNILKPTGGQYLMRPRMQPL